MKKDKFLTVYAVLDDSTQKVLSNLQKKIIQEFPYGTQTMDIPFHISLGSFPLQDKNKLICKLANLLEEAESFDLEITEMNHFDYKVIYAVPSINKELLHLHELFSGNYADGFPWIPHITLYCGTQEEGKQILKNYKVSKIHAKIVGLHLGEFFPTKLLMKCQF